MMHGHMNVKFDTTDLLPYVSISKTTQMRHNLRHNLQLGVFPSGLTDTD